MKLNHRYIARFIIEADTPLAVGTGEKGVNTDRLIAKDPNGLPYIPGTSIAGVLRHELQNRPEIKDSINSIFGFQEHYNDNGNGSRIIFSDANLLSDNGTTVIEGLQIIDYSYGYYSYFRRLPERDHVRINDQGRADNEGHGKFDEELVHKGTRFVFEIELIGNIDDSKNWEIMLNYLDQPEFRIGAGTRKGFGKLKVIKCQIRVFDLTNQHHLTEYLTKSSSLNSKLVGFEEFITTTIYSDYKHYPLEIKPKDFFLFGAGIGDEEVDMKPKTEHFIYNWETGKPQLTEEHLLIPATSIKGVLAHRVAFHYNRLTEATIEKQTNKPVEPVDIEKHVTEDLVLKLLDIDIDKIDLQANSPEWIVLQRKIESFTLENFKNNEQAIYETLEQELESNVKTACETAKPIFERNKAVRKLFGYAKDKDGGGARGNVIISDVYLPYNQSDTKIFNHVAIDRYTSGAKDGALYQERAVTSGEYKIDIFVKGTILEEDDKIKDAFENALLDISNGLLQLGGNTSKGHGVFNVELIM